jgi:hypothetical protein
MKAWIDLTAQFLKLPYSTKPTDLNALLLANGC